MCAMAKESSKIKKAREKLKKQIEKESEQVTPKALQKMNQAIRIWISRHAEDRINLKDKTFRLFDENKHPAKTKSQFVRHMSSQLQNQKAGQEEEKLRSLAGRIQKREQPSSD